MKLATKMKILVEITTAVMKKNAAGADPHLTTCHEVADQFDLWEKDENGGENFPLWLSFIVAGIGRDEGILM